VDVVNAFCIRDAEANMLDPGRTVRRFVVRATTGRPWLKHNEVSNTPACPIRLAAADLRRGHFSVAAHLCTLNLAARDIRDEENYRVSARQFSLKSPIGGEEKALLYAPQGLQGERTPGPVYCRHFDASLASALTCTGTHTLARAKTA